MRVSLKRRYWFVLLLCMIGSAVPELVIAEQVEFASESGLQEHELMAWKNASQTPEGIKLLNAFFLRDKNGRYIPAYRTLMLAEGVVAGKSQKIWIVEDITTGSSVAVIGIDSESQINGIRFADIVGPLKSLSITHERAATRIRFVSVRRGLSSLDERHEHESQIRWPLGRKQKGPAM